PVDTSKTGGRACRSVAEAGGPAGPPPQEQVDATLAWVSDVFREHYRASPPELPPRYGRREFGFLWNGKTFFLRHTSFTSKEAFHDFLVKEAPHHCYYSTAYYKTPHAATMKEKEWLGADLIFDLDADHLPGGDKLSFAEQLAAVKLQARKLLHEFILGDFGFDESHVRIVFSGGRGYHFHVTDPRVLQLDSAARREIVDYISPNDTVAAAISEGFVKERAYEATIFGLQKDRIIPPADSPGWDGMLTRTIVAFLEELRTMEKDAAKARLMTLDGIGDKTADEVLSMLTPERIALIRNEGRIAIPALGRSKALAGLVQYAKVHAEGETDEPVTADIKRLIRLPGSLHGKTGLRVTPLTIKEFERFDPLQDAVALGDEPTRVIVSKPTEVPLRGQRLMVQPGEQELPLYAATFVVLRRAALRPL
ncbi:MAG: DNA primase catalytic subunit PriS, partial [Candidatus Thermoplasmatota archaeon]